MKRFDNAKIQLNDCNWFHRTTEGRAKSIQANGFKFPSDPEANYQYTKGIYFLNNPHHSRSRDYGTHSIRTCIRGNFFSFDGDGREWWAFVDQFKTYGFDYDNQKKAIQTAYPHIDGLKLRLGGSDEMLVVWNPKSIVKIKNIEKIL